MKLQGFIVLFIVFLVYRLWFSFSGTLSSGDWPYLHKETIEGFSFLPQIEFLWLAPYYQIPTKIFVQYLGASWELVERLFWFWPFLIISILSSYSLTKSWIGVLVYTTNTYILMVVGGGQMGIAMAYAIAPFVLKKFIDFSNLQSEKILRGSIVFGLGLTVLTMFDPRIAYTLMIAVVVYVLFNIKNFSLKMFAVPVAIAALFNSYWIIPLLRGNLPQKYEGLSSAEGFEFLSFADFSHAFSLLHPNWPENIFGKTHFMQPEFILLPIIAFSSLLFVSKRNVLFFAFLGLLGVFLSKGANQPFGFLNQWVFEYIPGMNMFRDPSKFYLLIALGYSFLIPLSLEKLSKKVPFGKLLPVVFIVFWCILIRPAFFGQLGGTFHPISVPDEYIQLKDFLHVKPESFKTLWIPSLQRFGYVSKNHPGLSATDYFKVSSTSSVLTTIEKLDTRVKLRDSSIKYVIVPSDVRKELFITDRTYDEKLYKKTIVQLEQLSWLSKKQTFGDIVLFEIE